MHLACGQALDRLLAGTQPGDLDINRSLVSTQAEVQPQLVLVPLAGTTLDLSRQHPVLELHANNRADRRAIDLLAVTLERHRNPAVLRRRLQLVDPQLARRGQVQVTIVVDIAPGRLVGRRQAAQSLFGGDILELPGPLVGVEHRVVVAVDGREVEVQIAVVVEIAQRR